MMSHSGQGVTLDQAMRWKLPVRSTTPEAQHNIVPKAQQPPALEPNPDAQPRWNGPYGPHSLSYW